MIVSKRAFNIVKLHPGMIFLSRQSINVEVSTVKHQERSTIDVKKSLKFSKKIPYVALLLFLIAVGKFLFQNELATPEIFIKCKRISFQISISSYAK